MQMHKGVNALEGISDLGIIGIDERRPPIIRKEPYIDIFFKLSHKAPADWCNALNTLLHRRHPSSPKISEEEGLFIETWVKGPDEIVEFLALLKSTVADCNRQYIEQIESAARNACSANASLAEEAGEQGRLNRIIAELDFDEVKS